VIIRPRLNLNRNRETAAARRTSFSDPLRCGDAG
jgi:hypothetical protein